MNNGMELEDRLKDLPTTNGVMIGNLMQSMISYIESNNLRFCIGQTSMYEDTEDSRFHIIKLEYKLKVKDE
jgi:hypothetical protein